MAIYRVAAAVAEIITVYPATVHATASATCALCAYCYRGFSLYAACECMIVHDTAVYLRYLRIYLRLLIAHNRMVTWRYSPEHNLGDDSR
jgi:hypothetical protein